MKWVFSMNNEQINSLSELCIEDLTFADINWRYGTGRSKSTGEGRNKTHTYRTGVSTIIGDIREDIWYQLAEEMIERHGEQELFKMMLEWEKKRGISQQSSAENRHHAIKLHVMRIFDHPEWVDYIPFNRKYRPEVLARAHLVSVVTKCCKKPGQTTMEQIHASLTQTIHCPHCGRFSEYTVLEGESRL